ncbi:MAG: CHASE2 domain-containing protein [bacterium]
MTRPAKAILLGAITGVVGVLIWVLPFGHGFEEELGLALLFKLRGIRQPPPGVVVVNVDHDSAESLGLPFGTEKWPRHFHGKLVEKLSEAGASVIAFDIAFSSNHSPHEDTAFARSVQKAGNVVFCALLRRDTLSLSDERGLPAGTVNIERIEPPIALLEESAIAVAPFPLPRVPIRVNQYWTFKTSAGEVPTLPVVAFQIYAMNVYSDFIGLLEKHGASLSRDVPRKGDEILSRGNLADAMRLIRTAVKQDPAITRRILRDLEKSTADPAQRSVLVALTRLYLSPDSTYLNFYGPPHTIATIPFSDAYRSLVEGKKDAKKYDFAGKAVFIGSAESRQPYQKDGFYSVYTQPTGLDLGGVEIAATAFANVLEGKPVMPLPLTASLAVIILFGMAGGLICYVPRTALSSLAFAGFAVLYLALSVYLFKSTALWIPLMVPLLVQTPTALFGSALWKYLDSRKEQQKIRRAFSYYLPEDVIDRLTGNLDDMRTESRVVSGICLYTDIEQYTSLSEHVSPEELGSVINKFYEFLFGPVKQHGGVISNVVADSMLALWVSPQRSVQQRKHACLAALDVMSSVRGFNALSRDLRVTVRIGVNCGNIFLGNIGAMDHYEYRPVGDIVNTAARIEGLNKYLGTRILVTEEMAQDVDGILMRDMGRFLLYGKSKPVVVYELLCRKEEETSESGELCRHFLEALAAFQNREWDEASQRFGDIIRDYNDDGPSHFYLGMCGRFRENPPGPDWDGTIRMEKK